MSRDKNAYTITSTATCKRTPVVFFALHELGCKYEVKLVEPGELAAVHQTIGPALTHGDFVLLELDAILRYLARVGDRDALAGRGPQEEARIDQFMELQTRWWQGPLARMAGSSRESAARELATARRALGALERWLSNSAYALARFSVADLPSVLLMAAPLLGIELAQYPHLAAYLERLLSRPAWQRAHQHAREFGMLDSRALP